MAFWRKLLHRSQSQKRVNLLEEQYLMRGVPLWQGMERHWMAQPDLMVLKIYLSVVIEPQAF